MGLILVSEQLICVWPGLTMPGCRFKPLYNETVLLVKRSKLVGGTDRGFTHFTYPFPSQLKLDQLHQ